MQQTQADWYESWFGSPYYKILYENRDELEARAFIEKLLDHLQPPAHSRMLDIACGEGRFAIQLADHGFDVTGIDLSRESVEKANKHKADNLEFFVHDMRFPFYINYFDYAFNFFTSFGYSQRERDHMMAAKSFAAALKKNGLLIIDYLNKEYTVNNLSGELVIERSGHSFHIRKQLEHGYFVKEISFTDAMGNPRSFTETVAAFTLDDFTVLFQKAGLSLVAHFGDYQLNPYHATNSPRMIMIFKK